MPLDYAINLSVLEQPYNSPGNFLNKLLNLSSILESKLNLCLPVNFFNDILAILLHYSGPT